MKKRTNWENLAKEERDWIDAYLEGTIEEADFVALQERMMSSPLLRAEMRRALSLDEALQSSSDPSMRRKVPAGIDVWSRVDAGESATPAKIVRFPALFRFAAAASVAFLLGLGLMHWIGEIGESGRRVTSGQEEVVAKGFAVVSQLFDVEWRAGDGWREGDELGAETFELASGTAEIQFFSGATMTIEGPAEITLKSAWEASCREGAIRMQVPPAARGFRLSSPATDIVDLGTEFGLVVKDGKGHVEVIDGEIAVSHAGKEEKVLGAGVAWSLPANGDASLVRPGEVSFPDVNRFGSRAADEAQDDFVRWESHRDRIAADDRLIAAYTFDLDEGSSLVPNIALPRNPELDGAVILAERVAGRWPELKQALEFRRPGARVRVNIPGEFSAFTFAAWVRIDSLDRRYNALFLGDGYETGEPHWQIRDDGKLMLSVMVDDTKPNPGMPEDAGFHRVYFSPPIWDLSMSGQWMHLASVFDPVGRTVRHYVDGKPISSQQIEDRFFIDRLRIGNAEIGNWGLPFREEQWFAIRNLNGRMDEIAIFDAALDDAEIAELHQRSQARRR